MELEIWGMKTKQPIALQLKTAHTSAKLSQSYHISSSLSRCFEFLKLTLAPVTPYNPYYCDFRAYSLKVEHVAHNDAVAGSNPAKPNLKKAFQVKVFCFSLKMLSLECEIS